MLFEEAPLRLKAFLQAAPLRLVLVLIIAVELGLALGVLLVEMPAMILEHLLLLAQACFELGNLLLELLAERVLFAGQRLAVVLEEILDVALVASPELAFLGLDLLVEQTLLAFEILFLGADRVGLDLQPFEEGGLGVGERLLLVRQRGLKLALGILAGGLDRVDDLAAQTADRGLARGDLALERIDLHGQLEALFLDMRVLLAENLAAQLLAKLILHLLVIRDGRFPRLDRLAPALDRLVLLA